MASPLVRELLDSGIHFGHRCARWNPKMAAYIYGKRNGIHIIDIRETLRGLLRAKKFISQVVASGEDVLFVGTKRQARDIVKEQADRCKMHWVSERWLGGTLTNFRTIRSRLQRLEELEALVASPQWETGYSKKRKSTLSRELRKIRRNLDGIRRMNRLPSALIIVDLRKEHNAVREAKALQIPSIGLLDTDADPEDVTIQIPGNDDSIRSIAVVLRHLADSVEEGCRGRPQPAEPAEPREGPDYGTSPRRRSRRPGAPSRAAAAVSVDAGAAASGLTVQVPDGEPDAGSAQTLETLPTTGPDEPDAEADRDDEQPPSVSAV